MKPKEFFHPPKLADLGEFGRSEFANGIASIRTALIDEAWFDRHASHRDHHESIFDHEGSRREAGDRGAEDPFADRWSASDRARQRPERDHEKELDFDR